MKKMDLIRDLYIICIAQQKWVKKNLVNWLVCNAASKFSFFFPQWTWVKMLTHRVYISLTNWAIAALGIVQSCRSFFSLNYDLLFLTDPFKFIFLRGYLFAPFYTCNHLCLLTFVCAHVLVRCEYDRYEAAFIRIFSQIKRREAITHLSY